MHSSDGNDRGGGCALSGMVGKRLTRRESIPRTIRYKFGAAIKVQIDHSDGKSMCVFDRARSTGFASRLSRIGCRWPYREPYQRGRSHPEGAEFNGGTARLVAT